MKYGNNKSISESIVTLPYNWPIKKCAFYSVVRNITSKLSRPRKPYISTWRRLRSGALIGGSDHSAREHYSIFFHNFMVWSLVLSKHTLYIYIHENADIRASTLSSSLLNPCSQGWVCEENRTLDPVRLPHLQSSGRRYWKNYLHQVAGINLVMAGASCVYGYTHTANGKKYLIWPTCSIVVSY